LHDLAVLLQQAADEIASEYARIRVRTREDPGTAGDQGEENWAELLRRWLPATYHVVTKGRVIGVDGTASPQVDVLVLSPAYPRGLLRTKLYVASGVLAAFECKTTLRVTHIKKITETATAIGSINRQVEPLAHNIIFGILAHDHAAGSKRVPPEEALGDALYEADAALVENPLDSIDLVCVASLGTWVLLRGFLGDEKEILHSMLMGPVDSWMREGGDLQTSPNAIARFLTGLLPRLGPADPAIEPIARYFSKAGLLGIGKGRSRKWKISNIDRSLFPFLK
jgi:hypothetical protein